MKHCGRKRKSRNISLNYKGKCFKPCGIQAQQLETVTIYEDEIEAIRLADLEALYQQNCAEKMGVSRTTFSRIVENARRKIADALINNKKLEIISQ